MDKLNKIIESIYDSKRQKNYFAILTSTVVLIDVCASIEYSLKRYGPSKRYKKWVKEFLVPLIKEKGLTNYLEPINFWFLRNALLHEGSSNPNSNLQYQEWGKKRVRDIVPIANVNSEIKVFLADDGFEYPTLFFDIAFFSDLVCEGANSWIKKNEEKIISKSDNLLSVAIMIKDINGKSLIIREK